MCPHTSYTLYLDWFGNLATGDLEMSGLLQKSGMALQGSQVLQ